MDFNLTFWMLLSAVICLSPTLLYVFGVIKDPFHPLMFVGALTFFLATYFPLRNQQMLLGYLPGEIWARYQMLVCALVAAIYAGWHFSAWRRRRKLEQGVEEVIRPIDVAQYNPMPMFMIGSLLTVVGVIMFYATYGNKEISGYARDLGSLWLPGGLLLVQVLVSGPRLRGWAIVMLLLAVVPPVDRFLVYGQRGDTVRFALLGMGFFLAIGRRPPKALFIGAMVMLAITLSALGATRDLVESGNAKNRIDALLQVGSQFFTEKHTEISGGEEFAYGTMAIEHARQTHSWGHGAAVTWVPFVHVLPHEFFPWKFDYFYMHTNYDWNELRAMFGIQVANGSAPSGIADMYIDQWWFCLITWFLLGYGIHRAYLRALIPGNMRAQGFFIAFMVGLLYLITQEIHFGYLNVLYYATPMLIAYRMARIKAPEAEAAIQPAF